MIRQRRKGEANSPKRAKTGQSKLHKPSWPEFVSLAHQAVVAIAVTKRDALVTGDRNA
jgi:4'-phosphopantetheinyl transferase EntD